MKEIYLSNNTTALVDNEDFEYINQFRWNCKYGTNTNYAQRSYYIYPYNLTREMHIEIFMLHNIRIYDQIDHIDGNGLNNQKYNLRLATRSQNKMNVGLTAANTSSFKGVNFHKKEGMWRAIISYEKKHIHLGYFKTPEEAAFAYDNAAKRLFKEFAWLNFPKESK
jgi:hypothetical protein